MSKKKMNKHSLFSFSYSDHMPLLRIRKTFAILSSSLNEHVKGDRTVCHMGD